MRREIAERLAASKVPGIDVEQVRLILDEFFSQLAVCSVCGGSGVFTYDRRTTVTVATGNGGTEPRSIPKGMKLPCPRCVMSGSPRTDPDFVAWVCLDDQTSLSCRNEPRNLEPEPDHSHCGLRLFLPFDSGMLPAPGDAEL